MSKSFILLLCFNAFNLIHFSVPVSSFVPMIHSASSMAPATTTQTAHATAFNKFIPFYELSHYESLNHFSEKANHINEEVGKNIVMAVSEALPKFDTVGHKILSANHDFISDILQNDLLSKPMKKFIILASIKLAQMGDDIGSHILQKYYNLVESCL